MRILADLHHGQLYKSHELLFEKRLGHEVMRPIGRDWYDKGYWGWETHEGTIQQFLGHPNLLFQPRGLNGAGFGRVLTSAINEYHHMLIRYDAFMSMHFDLLLASLPAHVPVFQKISKEHQSHPKVALQMGNMWTNYPRDVKNILNATNIIIEPQIHSINYYPEFEIEHCRRPISPIDKSIASFLHLNSGHMQGLYYELEREIGWEIKEYGVNNRDQSIPDICSRITEKMLESQFIWHYKRGGEGYGFVIHEAFACGRPPLVNYEEVYSGQRAGEMMVPGVNCIDVGGKTARQIAEDLIAAHPRWKDMSMAAIEAFDSHVNFEEQAKQMQKFLDELV